MFKQPGQARPNIFTHLGCPNRGYDASSPLSQMAPTSAPILENFFPRTDGLITRDGYVTHITGIPKKCDRLHVYAAANGAESLWGSTNDGIYNFTTAGAAPALSIALTNGRTFSTAIATGAGNYMQVVNGTDTLKQYDGTSWTSIATFGATATSVYSYIETYRQRIFLVKRSSMEIEYLASNAIAGAATNYPLGALFRQGGFIVAMCVWTIDGGIGPEDNLCVMSNKGEVAVFAGNDPSSWALRGVYFAGRPMGDIPMTKYGGDVLLATETGIVAMSSLIQTASIDRTQTVSLQIRPYLIDAAKAYPTNQGWQIIWDPIKPFLLVNIPGSPVRFQAVMNSQSGAWCTYTGWNALHFIRRASELYFSGSDGSAGQWKVKRVNGNSDDGVNITATMLQAYNSFRYGGNKKFEEVKPYFQAAGAFMYNMGVATDFFPAREYTQLSLGTGLTAGVWGASLWGAALWSGTAVVSGEYQTPPDDYSQWKALYLQVVSRLGAVSYIGSDILYKHGGHF